MVETPFRLFEQTDTLDCDLMVAWLVYKQICQLTHQGVRYAKDSPPWLTCGRSHWRLRTRSDESLYCEIEMYLIKPDCWDWATSSAGMGVSSNCLFIWLRNRYLVGKTHEWHWCFRHLDLWLFLQEDDVVLWRCHSLGPTHFMLSGDWLEPWNRQTHKTVCF